MADHVDITLRIDWRWKDAIEKHLRDETLQEQQSPVQVRGRAGHHGAYYRCPLP